MRYTFLFIFNILFVLSFHAQSNDWNEMTDFGGGERERAVSFSIGQRGYVATGQDSTNSVQNDLWEYQPSSNTWTQKASMPTVGRRNAIAFSINGIGYVGTGIDSALGVGSGGNPLSDFWAYNPQFNSWTQKANYPDNFGLGIYFATGFSVGSRGYVCCGKKGPNNYSQRTYEYNPLNNTWVQRTNFPGGDRYALTSFSIGTKGYVGTGVDPNVMRKDFYAFTPSLNTWAPIADMPISGRSACSSFTIRVQGFIVFGTDGGFKDELWEYHVGFNMWFSRSSFPSDPRKGGIAFSVGDKGYAGTGKADTSGIRSNFYEYTAAWPVGINDYEDFFELNVYPNPASNYVNFSFKHLTNYQISIFNTTGKLIKNTTLANKNKLKIDLSDVTNGIYFYHIKINHSTTFLSGKLIVNK